MGFGIDWRGEEIYDILVKGFWSLNIIFFFYLLFNDGNRYFKLVWKGIGFLKILYEYFC